jgi:hypothetical protein
MQSANKQKAVSEQRLGEHVPAETIFGLSLYITHDNNRTAGGGVFY